MVYNAADEKNVNKTEKKESDKRKRYINDIREILKLPGGKRFFKELLERGHIFSTTFTGNSQTFFLEGERNFALRIFNDVCEAQPYFLAEIMKKEEEKEEQDV